MQSTPTPDTDLLSGMIRRLIRVLGAQPAHASRPDSLTSIARLLVSRLERANIAVRLIEGEHGTPLIVAGSGPIAVCTYLDDIHPDAIDSGDRPPDVIDQAVLGRGIERKAAIVAHTSALLTDPAWAQQVTLLIETDRHAGSHTMEAWLDEEEPRFTAMAWDVADLPLGAPALVRSATGSLIVKLTFSALRRRVETVYGTVLPDIGIAMARLVTSLKSADDEVHLDGFYDGIESLEENEFDAVVQIGPGVSRWLTHVAGDERELSTSHMTLGMFCAPSLIIRDIGIVAEGDYLPHAASAVIEFQLLPGQDVDRVLAALRDRVSEYAFDGRVEVLLDRRPVALAVSAHVPSGYASLPIAPGPSPAALFAARGIAGTGYTVVSRSTDRETTGIAMESIVEGTRFLYDLSASLAMSPNSRA